MTEWEALVQYHFKVDPDTLSDEKFARYIGRLQYALSKTGQWGS